MNKHKCSKNWKQLHHALSEDKSREANSTWNLELRPLGSRGRVRELRDTGWSISAVFLKEYSKRLAWAV